MWYKSFCVLFFFASCMVLPPAAVAQTPYHALSNENDLDILLKEIDTSRIVILGEASHGTAEYYTWRMAISKRLITEKGFSFIAVEGDWTDAYTVNNFIAGAKQDSNAVIAVLKAYHRWPTWLWANYEMASLVSWMNEYNQNRPAKDKIGFYGLDLFNIAAAANDIKMYLTAADTAARQAIKNFQQCFAPYANDEQQYPKIIPASCKERANHLWEIIHTSAIGRPAATALAMEQDARVVLDGEQYLSTRSNAADRWNARDNHMAETVTRLLNLYGGSSKVVIWTHNSHAGDAQYSSMIWAGKTNLGNLLRYRYGAKNLFIVGLGSYSGDIIAAEKWGAPYKKMTLALADDSTWEQKMHQAAPGNKIIICRELKDKPALLRWMFHAGIGVIYHPYSRVGIYSLSVVPNRYDAFLFFDHTHALHPIDPPVQQRASAGTNVIDF